MNIKQISASVLLLVAATGAFAGTDTPSSSSDQAVTRQQARDELLRAPLPSPAAPSALTRESVKADVIRARAAGELDQNEMADPFTRTSSTTFIGASKK